MDVNLGNAVLSRVTCRPCVLQLRTTARLWQTDVLHLVISMEQTNSCRFRTEQLRHIDLTSIEQTHAPTLTSSRPISCFRCMPSRTISIAFIFVFQQDGHANIPEISPASIPSIVWSDAPDNQLPESWSSVYWSTVPWRVVVPQERTYENSSTLSLRKRPHSLNL